VAKKKKKKLLTDLMMNSSRRRKLQEYEMGSKISLFIYSLATLLLIYFFFKPQPKTFAEEITMFVFFYLG